MQQLPITEKEISQWTDAPVYSPILCASLAYLGIDQQTFIDFFKDSFVKMPWDYYDVKRKQWEALPAPYTKGREAVFKQYYTDSAMDLELLAGQLDLPKSAIDGLSMIRPWRRRSVCSFDLNMADGISIQRVYPKGFEQSMDEADIRSLPRVFAETESELVENDLFYGLMRKVAEYAQQVTPHIQIEKIQMTAHFMSVKARQGVPGNNSPEGAHEDGADFIVSALVISRDNIAGGKSQVFEKMEDGSLVTLFERELQPGEFLFQADTGEEKHYGNDLWHYVTPFYVEGAKTEAWRNIIGFDIAIAPPKI